MMFVVVAPFAVTLWRVSMSVGQFVPSNKQTEVPFTLIDDAFNVVPLAVVKPNQEVDVPLVNVRFDAISFVTMKFVANKFVLVVLVPVAFVQMRFVRFDGAAPMTVRFAMVAFVAKKFVVVALVDVVFVKTPVDGVVAPIVVPLIAPPKIVAFDEVNVGAVSEAIVPFVAFTVVPEATLKPNQEVDVPFVKVRLVTVPFVMVPLVRVPFVANRFVEVVFVPVALVQVRFVKLDGLEPLTVRFVIVALVAKKFVVVAFVDVTFVATRLPSVVWPVTFSVPVAVRFNVWMPPSA